MHRYLLVSPLRPYETSWTTQTSNIHQYDVNATVACVDPSHWNRPSLVLLLYTYVRLLFFFPNIRTYKYKFIYFRSDGRRWCFVFLSPRSYLSHTYSGSAVRFYFFADAMKTLNLLFCGRCRVRLRAFFGRELASRCRRTDAPVPLGGRRELTVTR